MGKACWNTKYTVGIQYINSLDTAPMLNTNNIQLQTMPLNNAVKFGLESNLPSFITSALFVHQKRRHFL